jgi:hypothetical protein
MIVKKKHWISSGKKIKGENSIFDIAITIFGCILHDTSRA